LIDLEHSNPDSDDSKSSGKLIGRGRRTKASTTKILTTKIRKNTGKEENIHTKSTKKFTEHKEVEFSIPDLAQSEITSDRRIKGPHLLRIVRAVEQHLKDQSPLDID
jgi:hypothetical protein